MFQQNESRIPYTVTEMPSTSVQTIMMQVIKVPVSLKSGGILEYTFLSQGAALSSVRLYPDAQDPARSFLLTLSYADLADFGTNPSCAGLTIGPNAGRLPADGPLSIRDGQRELTVDLPANENTNQIHGGNDNLARRNWDLKEIREGEDTISVTFTTTLPDALEEWPGNRTFTVTYLVREDGSLTITLEGESDRLTYLNLTNHTYWKREGLSLNVFADHVIENRPDARPDHMEPLPYPLSSSDHTNRSRPEDEKGSGFQIKKEAIWNNGFLLHTDPFCYDLQKRASLFYEPAGLQIDLLSDAPALVVYTGDYLDGTAVLQDGSVSAPAGFIALEPQELYPVTGATLCDPDHPFSRTIRLQFTF